jgi:hypothetical protein
MEWWVSAGTSSVLFVVAGWLVRQLLVTRLTNSVEDEFNKSLEKYRAELKASEENLKAALKAKEADVSALRSSAISSLANRQTKLDDRKLQAVDDIWTAVIELAPAKFTSSLMVSIKFEEMAEAAVNDPRVREILGLFEKNIDPNNFRHKNSPAKSRPFVSPMLWASFSAYSAILMQAVMRAYAIKSGVGARDFMDNEKISALLKSVLPHQSGYVDKFGPSAYHHLVEEIETKIIHEMHLTISGVDSDEASVKQAAKILELSSSLLTDTSVKSVPSAEPEKK